MEHIGKNSLYYYGVNVLTLKIVGILTFGLLNDGGSECVVLMKCLVKVVLAIGISSMFLPGFNMARNFLLAIINAVYESCQKHMPQKVFLLVIWLATHNAVRPVDLLQKNDPHQLVWKGHL